MERLILQVLPSKDSDAEEMADLGRRLRNELLEYDVSSVGPLHAEEAPPGAKGMGQVVGWLVAQFANPEGLQAVIVGVRNWATRNRQCVEVTIDGDTLKLSDATPQQQQDAIDAWLARHGARA